jgi:hypothetical protein
VHFCVAYAHRKQLNQKLVLPDSVKEILRCPRDEVSPAKLELLCGAVRREIEGETVVFLRTERDIASLAAAVEGCRSVEFADEVGKDATAIPEGARVSVGVDESLPHNARRLAVAALVRSMHEGDPVCVKLRPLRTSRQPLLDTFARELMRPREPPPDTSARELMRRPYKTFCELAGKRPIEEMRDRLLLCLWDAMFLSACERWTTEAVTNITPSDALELGYWFQRGQQNSKKPLFEGLCAMCGCLLYVGSCSMGNTCYGPPGHPPLGFDGVAAPSCKRFATIGPPMNRDGRVLVTAGVPETNAQPPCLLRYSPPP